MRSLTPELDRVILDTHQAAAYPEAARELRALKAVARAAASDPDPHHRVKAALDRLEKLGKKGGARP